MKLNSQTLTIIHNCYVCASENSKVLLIRLMLFKDLLIAHLDEITDEDKSFYTHFLTSVENSYTQRIKDEEIQNDLTNLYVKFIKILVKYINITENKCINVRPSLRKKGLESELKKLLFKSITNNSEYDIRDRFGLKFIFENISEITLFFSILKDILTIGEMTERKKDFIKFLSTDAISTLDKNMIAFLLSYQIKIEHVKNYIAKPKSNGYRSLQFSLNSEQLAGCKFEIQLQTPEMDENARNGDAAHNRYKNKIPEEIKNVFTYSENIDENSGIKKEVLIPIE